jgi:hypothetical protein
MLDLSGFDWNDNVSFYLGCSFSCEKVLIDAGIYLQYVEDNQPVPMYMTNIDCHNVKELFTGAKLIVSMRPIKRVDLNRVVSITSCYPLSHGAPIHIGDPSLIGINDVISSTIVPSSVSVANDEVTVFWACGVTGKQAIEALGAGLCFTHYPASMFITDVLVESTKQVPSSEDDVPVVVQSSPSKLPYFASLVRENALKKLRELEEIILDDPGHCGVKKLREDGDFVKSVISLSHARSVAVIFGFPCNISEKNMEETDGPPGALAIAQSLMALGKDVIIVSEERNRDLVNDCVEYLYGQGALKSKVRFRSCREVVESKGVGFDCLVAIERVGQASDGCHYSSRGIDLSEHLEPIDQLFSDAPCVTIGIGDRGNELGLGKIQQKVTEVMEDGAKLGCSIASDNVIMAGVSNWGAYGICAGLYILATCPVHWRYVTCGINSDDQSKDFTLDQFVPTNEQVEGVLERLNENGVCDGISKSFDKSVDGLPLLVHLNKLNQLRNAATKN